MRSKLNESQGDNEKENNKSNSKDIVSKLYVDAEIKAVKMRNYVSPDIDYEKSKGELTFSPRVGHV
jgi:hypothetical protein